MNSYYNIHNATSLANFHRDLEKEVLTEGEDASEHVSIHIRTWKTSEPIVVRAARLHAIFVARGPDEDDDVQSVVSFPKLTYVQEMNLRYSDARIVAPLLTEIKYELWMGRGVLDFPLVQVGTIDGGHYNEAQGRTQTFPYLEVVHKCLNFSVDEGMASTVFPRLWKYGGVRVGIIANDCDYILFYNFTHRHFFAGCQTLRSYGAFDHWLKNGLNPNSDDDEPRANRGLLYAFALSFFKPVPKKLIAKFKLIPSEDGQQRG